MSMLQPVTERHPAFAMAERRWSEMKADRAQDERMWGDIARLMRPQRGGFDLSDPAMRPDEKPLSSAPIHAQSNFAAGLYGTLTNPANRWFGMETNDPDLNAWHPARLWLDTVTTRVLASFSPAVSPFYSAASQVFSDLAAFGNAAQYDEARPAERRILDVTISLAEACFDIDGFGMVTEVVRRFLLTPARAMSMFGPAALPARVQDLAVKGDTGKIAFYHHVIRNDAWRQGMLGLRGRRWLSRYVCEVDAALVREAGYDEMPFHAPRWEVDTGRIYGTGPGFVALASARALTRMDDATLRMAQRQADPTILAPDRGDWPLNGTVRPGTIVFGGTNMRGDPMLRPLDISGGISLTLQEKQQKLEEIRDAFHYTLMNLAGRTGMTATEVMAITEERQRLWAPHQGRVQEEFLAPKIERRFAILWRAGQIPPPPKELAGRPLIVRYQSAAAAAQRSVEGNAALRILQDIAPLAQLKPRLLDRLDEDGLLETLVEARGAPARMIRSREDADAIAEARAQQEQAMQAVQMAQAGAGALKDAAGAAAAMQGGGGVPA
ncbi:MAG TPA: portal protein [Paracoccaceae bacterium]|nr:portal protein [Paracoccaceae bacterium]